MNTRTILSTCAATLLVATLGATPALGTHSHAGQATDVPVQAVTIESPQNDMGAQIPLAVEDYYSWALASPITRPPIGATLDAANPAPPAGTPISLPVAIGLTAALAATIAAFSSDSFTRRFTAA